MENITFKFNKHLIFIFIILAFGLVLLWLNKQMVTYGLDIQERIKIKKEQIFEMIPQNVIDYITQSNKGMEDYIKNRSDLTLFEMKRFLERIIPDNNFTEKIEITILDKNSFTFKIPDVINIFKIMNTLDEIKSKGYIQNYTINSIDITTVKKINQKYYDIKIDYIPGTIRYFLIEVIKDIEEIEYVRILNPDELNKISNSGSVINNTDVTKLPVPVGTWSNNVWTGWNYQTQSWTDISKWIWNIIK